MTYWKPLQFLSSVVAFVLVLSLSDAGSSRQAIAQAERVDSGKSIPAFPGAEGYGACAKGGRGGNVFFVTNLEDYEPGDEAIPGSLRAAVKTPGPRIVIFRVSGIITLKAPLKISAPYLTLAGQTAPGGGICLKNHETQINGTHDIIVRHLRFRPGDAVGKNLAGRGQPWETDALSVFSSQDVIIDHCSASWGNDEVLSLTGVDLNRITIQWTMITESMNQSTHSKGAHGYGSIAGGHIGHGKEAAITIHHNVYAHHNARNPHFAGDRDGLAPGSRTDFRNNVIYDWGKIAAHNYTPQYTKVNFIKNYLKPGPSTRENQRKVGLTSGSKNGHFYLEGNQLAGFADANKDNWLLVDTTKGVTRLDAPLPVPSVMTDDVEIAFRRVLADCGATKPKRDAVDVRVLEEITTGGGRLINSQKDVGGWPELRSTAPPADADRDGMADAWETANNLDPKNPEDRNGDADKDGYTNLEEYLNSLCPQLKE